MFVYVTMNFLPFYDLLWADKTVAAVNSLCSVHLAVTASFPLILFPPLTLPLHDSLSLSRSLSLCPSWPLLWPINRPVGGDGGPLREMEHFGWFPEKGNDRPRQYPVLHLLRTPSALLTRLEANTRRTWTVSAQVIQLMSRWMVWDVLITRPKLLSTSSISLTMLVKS